MKKKHYITIKKAGAGLAILAALCCGAACSSTAPSSGEAYGMRNRAESQLEQGIKQADRGDYSGAMILLNEGKRLAVAADDPVLRVRLDLSRGNVLFDQGQREDAAAIWESALGEAEKWGNQELAAVSRIHQARGRLLAARGDRANAQSVRDAVNREMPLVKNRLYTAFSWLVIALAEKELGRSAEAEAAVKSALDIHEKDTYLEQAAYDWFLIASFRSLSGNYSGAQQALESAMALDRRVENSYGLATDWRALGDVLKKAGKTAESRAAYFRSAEIFRSLGNETAAAETEQLAPR